MSSFKKKSLSTILLLAMVLALVSSALPIQDAQAAGGAVAGSKSFEPWSHGYRFVDILTWDPETDIYQDEMIGYVPLQERIDPLQATQAHPNLHSKAQLLNISVGNYRSTDTERGPFNGNHYYDEFPYQVYKFWQYTDMIGSGGKPGPDMDPALFTPGVAYNNSSSWFMQYGGNYGIVAIPAAPYINAAHKNGVKIIGEIFFPRAPQFANEWLYETKDEEGNTVFPYAQKLVDVMKYYGFDGYFFNQEDAFSSAFVSLYKRQIQYMMNQGCYVQMYDGITDSGSGTSYQQTFNATNSNYVYDTNASTNLGRVSNSMFIDYKYTQAGVNNGINHAISKGLDPFETVFFGVEGGNGRFGNGTSDNGYQSAYQYPFIKGSDGLPRASLAIWGGDFNSEWYSSTSSAGQWNKYKTPYQWQVEERERMYYTTPTMNADATTFGTISRTDVQVTNTNTGRIYQGFASFIAERSVIGGSVFTTNFGTGHGLQYWKNGEIIRNKEWTNINIQDIMPTWQWWKTGTYHTNLNMDWDYGPNYTRMTGSGTGTLTAFNFSLVGAYNGGSSLVVYGSQRGTNFINLFKTDLAVKAASKISLTYRKPSANDASTLRLGLIFKDAPTVKEYLSIPNGGDRTTGWVTSEFDLGAYAGRSIAAIGLEIASGTASAIANYQVNLGQLKISDGTSYTPDAPTGFQIDRCFDSTGELQLSWDLADYSDVKLYNVYAVYANGSERYVSGVYAPNFYIRSLEDRANVVDLKLVAVGADGSESAGVTIPLDTSKSASNIRAGNAGNKLTVTWDEPAGDFESVKVEMNYWYSKKTDPAPVTLAKGVKTAEFPVPVEDGFKYILTVTTINADGSENQPAKFFGVLADNLCEPYDGVLRWASGTVNGTGTFYLTQPSNADRNQLLLYRETAASPNPTPTTYRIRGTWQDGSLAKVNNLAAIASTQVALSVSTTDKYGNASSRVLIARRTPFNYNGATGGNSTVEILLVKGMTYNGAGGTLPTPTKTYAKFDGWFRSATFEPATQVTNATIVGPLAYSDVLYAKWIDKAALRDAILAFEGLVVNDWTPASWAIAKAAYDEAVLVFADGDATQEEIDDAKDALLGAIDDLIPLVFTIGGQQPSVVLRKGMTYQLNINSNSPTTVVYISSNANATVSATGLVTAVKTGSAVITVIDVLAQAYFTVTINITS
ncbi:MAG: Ig-like domain-containing protein [Oscillospiraceae bacterium]|nr:Ig-like domain-containing protein [Oscillospiraceae bacterium]